MPFFFFFCFLSQITFVLVSHEFYFLLKFLWCVLFYGFSLKELLVLHLQKEWLHQRRVFLYSVRNSLAVPPEIGKTTALCYRISHPWGITDGWSVIEQLLQSVMGQFSALFCSYAMSQIASKLVLGEFLYEIITSVALDLRTSLIWLFFVSFLFLLSELAIDHNWLNFEMYRSDTISFPLWWKLGGCVHPGLIFSFGFFDR